MKAAARQQLDTSRKSDKAQKFETDLHSKVVGQDEAIQKLVKVYQVFLAGLNAPGRPVASLLFLGPTGVGKTRIAEATAETLLGSMRALLMVHCAEFQHSHEIAKLVGSPPGYLGHRETHPMITQEVLSQYYTEDLKLSFVLFDEIEKANDALWQLLLGILDKATLTLGDNRIVHFDDTMVFLTSNLGGREIEDLLHPKLGFAPPEPGGPKQARVESSARDAAKRKFTPEFMNRLDEVVVFHPLSPVQLADVLTKELAMVQDRVLRLAGRQFLFHVTDAGREFLLREGTDPRYNARHLKRAVEKHVTNHLASLLATGQVRDGDSVTIDYDDHGLVFTGEAQGAIAVPDHGGHTGPDHHIPPVTPKD